MRVSQQKQSTMTGRMTVLARVWTFSWAVAMFSSRLVTVSRPATGAVNRLSPGCN